MSRFSYDANGWKNRETDLAAVEELLGDKPVNLEGQPMEISNPEAVGRISKLEKHYFTLARAVISLMILQKLESRQLASGVYAYTSERTARLEPGLEAVIMPEDLIAINFNDFFKPPEGYGAVERPSGLWVAQSLIDYDYGVQHRDRIG